MRGSFLSCSHAYSLEPAEPQLPHSPVQDYRPCSTHTITQPQHSPPQRQHSPTPHSPARVGTLHSKSPTQDSKPTLDQESPGSSSPAQDISTLDQDLSARRDTSLRPISAPCSPSPAPLRATQCSLSQPASPVQAPLCTTCQAFRT
ncbi:hypothetical protein E3U43_016761 [Larimichthys crocea]|nr:hypothetical protein E3U43_016761 [Larimichthys crocea]